MALTISDDSYVLDADELDWVPAGPGLDFKPLGFLHGNAGWVQLLRLEPGTVIPRHRHTGVVHALTLTGQRRLLGTGRVAGPLTYVHEQPGDIDSWMAVGDGPCVVHVEVHGTVEYLGPDGDVELVVDAELQRRLYLDACAARGRQPHPALVADYGDHQADHGHHQDDPS